MPPTPAPSGQGPAAPHPFALGRLVITTLAALLLLVGPLLSSAVGVGKSDARTRAAVPTRADDAGSGRISSGHNILTGNASVVGNNALTGDRGAAG